MSMRDYLNRVGEAIYGFFFPINEGRPKTIEDIIYDRLQDRRWCKAHEIDYVDPDFSKAYTEILKEIKEYKIEIRR